MTTQVNWREAGRGALPGRRVLSELPEGLDGYVLSELVRGSGGLWLHVAREDHRASALAETVRFFAPDLAVVAFPAWDCLPYDRVSPRPEIVAERMAALARLALRKEGEGPLLVIATVNGLVQRVPERTLVSRSALAAHVGNRIALEEITRYLAENGFSRSGIVTEPGDFAVRGGVVDLFPPGAESPVRLDFFGDTLEAIRSFDPETQRSTRTLDALSLSAVSEVRLDEAAVQRFRRGYVAAFGAVTDDDPLYEAVSAGRKHPGMEHWLPLFHERLETLFDYVGAAPLSFDALSADAHEARLEAIADFHKARIEAGEREGRAGGVTLGASRYKPLAPEALYLTAGDWTEALAERAIFQFEPFDVPDAPHVVKAGGRRARSFAPERAQPGVNVFDALAGHLQDLERAGRRVLIASSSDGARERMASVLGDHGVQVDAHVSTGAELFALAPGQLGLATLMLEAGFEAPDQGGFAILSEQDILGDRMIRTRARRRRADNFLTEAATLESGDLVVHVDHGIGRYEGLKTLDVQGAPHDCLLILYQGGDKLYVPVENIELLSRFGADDGVTQLDRLGGGNWQARKARLKEKLRDIAEGLIKIAAERAMRAAPAFDVDGLYEEFSARFPYEETEDQDRAIADVIEDLSAGRPMDRLVCGDVGFGKTEVALRAAFLAAMNGVQVAVVVPTTLLARQHFKTFSDRFSGLPLRVRMLSRLVSSKEASEIRAGLADGTVNIVIGTHALLSKTIKFRDLGLLIVDEEQHFGVTHKERLKQLRANVHVLTLTATPIPRTLQLAMSGIRELSIIATPPVDRLAVRTFVTPFDSVIVREALLREHYRGGQSFYVCPRISDIKEATDFLETHVPEVKFVTAHGQMAPSELEDRMTAFYEGRYDVLVSTTIVESGLDIPTANTMIVHRADMYGLAQLYQLRGRIGRSKTRAYCYLTVPQRKTLTAAAGKRLDVLQSLDTLGAGFTLASHDLDIRGAGNLLGEEQSGHVREVGVELYQQMLEEAVASLRSGDLAVETGGTWSPQINLGLAVLIPETYVEDLDVRLGLYRRLSELTSAEGIDGFAAELIDRFGPLPPEAEALLDIVGIKQLCREANVEKVDAGPKGAVLTFRDNSFPNPAGLIAYVANPAAGVRLRPDQKIVVGRDWDSVGDRVQGTRRVLQSLARIAAEARAA
ncbi:MAG: transcription-repair coupling factor [Alphaproteobacteria bacterium]|nr:transcription-repair coupling factor [Alphaproteobacteria bacterium]